MMKLAVLPHGAIWRERRPGVVILGYHRIGGGTASDIDLPALVFARQMAYLREHYDVIGMDELLEERFRKDAASTRDLVAVTFDDGYRETYIHAFPVLQQFQIPATVYVATDYVDRQRELDFGEAPRHGSKARPLTWAMLREMADTGLITIGAHTHRHADLTRLSPTEVREEVARSRQTIEDRLGMKPRHFAYPWGVLTPDVRAMAGRFFDTAVRGGCGKNVFGAFDLLALWRRPLQRSDGMAFFRLKVHSYLDGEEYFRTLAVHRGQLRSGSRQA